MLRCVEPIVTQSVRFHDVLEGNKPNTQNGVESSFMMMNQGVLMMTKSPKEWFQDSREEIKKQQVKTSQGKYWKGFFKNQT